MGEVAVTCKERSKEWVHLYAAGGGTFAAVAPIPGVSSLGLAAIETHMIYWIARIYGEDLSVKEIAMVAGGLEIGGLVLKAAAMEALNFIPVAGWILKGTIAVGAIESIGIVIVRHYEQKYPGKMYSVDPSVEGSVKRK